MIREMNTYFFQFKVVPTTNNEKYQLVEGAFASCWVLEKNPETAVTKAAFQVSKYDWEITGLDIIPIEVSEEHFTQRDIGLEQFGKAQTDGMAIVYMAWARDKKTSTGPVTHKSSYKPDLQSFIKEQKKPSSSG